MYGEGDWTIHSCVGGWLFGLIIFYWLYLSIFMFRILHVILGGLDLGIHIPVVLVLWNLLVSLFLFFMLVKWLSYLQGLNSLVVQMKHDSRFWTLEYEFGTLLGPGIQKLSPGCWPDSQGLVNCQSWFFVNILF